MVEALLSKVAEGMHIVHDLLRPIEFAKLLHKVPEQVSWCSGDTSTLIAI